MTPSASRRRRASWARFSQRRAETNFRLGKWRGYTPFAQEMLVSHARDNIGGSLKRAPLGVVSGVDTARPPRKISHAVSRIEERSKPAARIKSPLYVTLSRTCVMRCGRERIPARNCLVHVKDLSVT